MIFWKEGRWNQCLCVLLRCRVAWTPVPAELSQWFCRTDYQLSRHRKPSPILSLSRGTGWLWTLIISPLFPCSGCKTAMPTQAACEAVFHCAKPTRNHTTVGIFKLFRLLDFTSCWKDWWKWSKLLHHDVSKTPADWWKLVYFQCLYTMMLCPLMCRAQFLSH